jgi:hypothetical protein
MNDKYLLPLFINVRPFRYFKVNDYTTMCFIAVRLLNLRMLACTVMVSTLFWMIYAFSYFIYYLPVIYLS